MNLEIDEIIDIGLSGKHRVKNIYVNTNTR